MQDKSVLDYLLGEMPKNYFIACLLMAYLGHALRMLREAADRDKPSTRTPEDFKTWFMIVDNGPRVIFNLLFIPIAVRFFPDIVDNVGGAIAGMDLPKDIGTSVTLYVAILIGIGIDYIANRVFPHKTQDLSKKQAAEPVEHRG